MYNALEANTSSIKYEALRLGFMQCGIAEATMLDADARRLDAWLSKGYHGSMAYMANHFDLRVDPRKLVPDAKSVITLAYNYFPAQEHNTDGPRISKYAYGQDYHLVIKQKLNTLLAHITQHIGQVHGRGFVDSAPVLERSWAVRSGLGWVGKNGNLISKQKGSFFFLATLILDLALVYDAPMQHDHCGSCTACIDACPTQAILPNKVINGEQCISHYTIELKDALIPKEHAEKFDNWMFGCDTCQDVCPWNRFSQPHAEPLFNTLPQILNLRTKQWLDMSEEEFKSTFKQSPLSRSKWTGIQRNIKALSQ